MATQLVYSPTTFFPAPTSRQPGVIKVQAIRNGRMQGQVAVTTITCYNEGNHLNCPLLLAPAPLLASVQLS